MQSCWLEEERSFGIVSKAKQMPKHVMIYRGLWSLAVWPWRFRPSSALVILRAWISGTSVKPGSCEIDVFCPHLAGQAGLVEPICHSRCALKFGAAEPQDGRVGPTLDGSGRRWSKEELSLDGEHPCAVFEASPNLGRNHHTSLSRGEPNSGFCVLWATLRHAAIEAQPLSDVSRATSAEARERHFSKATRSEFRSSTCVVGQGQIVGSSRRARIRSKSPCAGRIGPNSGSRSWRSAIEDFWWNKMFASKFGPIWDDSGTPCPNEDAPQD